MISHYVDAENHILEVTVAGKINREELGRAMKDFEGPLKEWPEVRVLKRVDSFEGMDLMALYDDIKFAFENWSHYKKLKKTAIVTDKDWISKLADWSKSIVPGEVEIFENEDIEKAREWLR